MGSRGDGPVGAAWLLSMGRVPLSLSGANYRDLSAAQTAASRRNHIKPGWAPQSIPMDSGALPSSVSPSIILLTAPGRGALCTLPQGWGSTGTTSTAEAAEHRKGLITAKPQQIR